MSRFAGFDTYDVRFPTSLTADGSDAMNREADYSAAYVVARTDGEEYEGHGFASTIGRGNDVQLAAIREVTQRFVGRGAPAARGVDCPAHREPEGVRVPPRAGLEGSGPAGRLGGQPARPP